MIFDIRNPPIEGKVTFECSCGLLFCQTLGWFDKYLSMQEFFEAEPIITIRELDDRDVCSIMMKDNEMLVKEIALSMNRLGFILVNQISGIDKKLYRYEHIRKKK
jgi:hypothetical protein